jgi:hypothetical protein
MEKMNVKYEFRGYRLLKCDYNRIKDQPITSFSVICKKNLFDKNTGIYEIVTEFELVFGEEKSLIVFAAGFKINELEWLELTPEAVVVNDFFRIAYPFFTAKVQAYTSDFRPGFMLPALDFRKFDFTKRIGMSFSRVPNDNGNTGVN